jgi:photosystem II stability/assembly factor-like uncharacterized protein
MRLHHLLLGLTLAATQAHAQWDIEDSHTTASLRGIHNVGGGVAWASGTNGTVLRTEDGGYLWQTCNIPPGAEKLDFRGIQAFDENTAIVMSSGTGDLSRLYKTTDGCQTWKLLFTNPDKEGFWDAIVAKNGRGFLIGDPVANRFVVYASSDGKLEQWSRFGEHSSLHEFKFDLTPYEGEEFFAASNSILQGDPSSGITFVSGGGRHPFCSNAIWSQQGIGGFPTFSSFKSHIPLAIGATAGAFSFANKGEQTTDVTLRHSHQFLVAVGGDYKEPDSSSGTAAWSKDGGQHWHAATAPPHGYRSSVAYDAQQRLWITVGPNGTDISRDDGKNWAPLKPSGYDPPDADKNWNALSLPFVVGPHGRIGRLRTIDNPKK